MNEVWKDIPGYEGLYQVSNLGRVKSVGRYVQNRTGLRRVCERIISADEKSNGYFQVQLHKDGVRKKHLIHRLVATAFLENPDGRQTVNHKNGDKSANFADNLEWATIRENNVHAYAAGLKDGRNNRRSVPVAQYDTSMRLLAIYPSAHEAERKTGIPQGNISQSVRLGCKARGYFWKLAE